MTIIIQNKMPLRLPLVANAERTHFVPICQPPFQGRPSKYVPPCVPPKTKPNSPNPTKPSILLPGIEFREPEFPRPVVAIRPRGRSVQKPEPPEGAHALTMTEPVQIQWCLPSKHKKEKNAAVANDNVQVLLQPGWKPELRLRQSAPSQTFNKLSVLHRAHSTTSIAHTTSIKVDGKILVPS
jgi:hypothetical protein